MPSYLCRKAQRPFFIMGTTFLFRLLWNSRTARESNHASYFHSRILRTTMIRRTIFFHSVFPSTQSAQAQSVYFTSRQKIIEKLHLQPWTAPFGLKMRKACICTFHTSTGQNWQSSSNAFYQPTNFLLSSYYCFILSIKCIKHSVSNCQCIRASPFCWSSATSAYHTTGSKVNEIRSMKYFFFFHDTVSVVHHLQIVHFNHDLTLPCQTKDPKMSTVQ